MASNIEGEIKAEIQSEIKAEMKSSASASAPALLGLPSNEINTAEQCLGCAAVLERGRNRSSGKCRCRRQSALSSIFGVPVKFVLNFLEGTGEGKRLVKFAGHAIEQCYEVQKASFRGHLGGVVGAFEGGSSHQQRESKFFAAVTDRIHELQTKGGALTAQDVAGFKQAIADGDIHPLGTEGLDLSKLDLAVGTNPFRTDLPEGRLILY